MAQVVDEGSCWESPEQLSLGVWGQQGSGRAKLPPTPQRAWDTLAWSAARMGLGDTSQHPSQVPRNRQEGGSRAMNLVVPGHLQ